MEHERKPIRNKIIRTVSITVLCVALGIMLAVVYKGVKKEKQNTESDETVKTVEQLQSEVIELTNKIGLLEQEKETLSQKVKLYENSTGEERLKALSDKNEELSKMAGISPVTGAGITVALNYTNEGDVGSSQSYLLALINELKAAEAQAISVNGERIIAMSELRAVSNYIVVNGNVYYSPFTINATGDRAKLESALKMSGIIKNLENFFASHGGSVTLATADEVTVPGISEEYAEEITNKLKAAG